MHELGELLRKLRGRESLRDAAKRSGLSYSYISSLEKGKHPKTGAPIKLTPESLRGLSKAYNYPYEELMKIAGHIDRNLKNELHNEETKTQIEKDRNFAYEVIDRIPEEKLNLALELLKELARE